MATKTVTILARYAVKASGSIVYAVRNGENKEYCVTLNTNGSTGCVERANGEECKGHKYAHRAGHECHHITECQAKEAARVVAPAAEVVEAMNQALEGEREEEQQSGIERAQALVAERKAAREQAALDEALTREARRQERAAAMETAGLSWEKKDSSTAPLHHRGFSLLKTA